MAQTDYTTWAASCAFTITGDCINYGGFAAIGNYDTNSTVWTISPVWPSNITKIILRMTTLDMADGAGPAHYIIGTTARGNEIKTVTDLPANTSYSYEFNETERNALTAVSTFYISGEPYRQIVRLAGTPQPFTFEVTYTEAETGKVMIAYIGGAASGMSVYTGGASPVTSYTTQFPIAAIPASNWNNMHDPMDAMKSDNIAIDGWDYQSWTPNWTSFANSCINIDLGSAKTIQRIYYENAHTSGEYTQTGSKDFTFWGSNLEASYNETTYAIDTGWTQLTCNVSELIRHTASNVLDPQYVLVTNDTAYRYYRLKVSSSFDAAWTCALRRLQLQVAA